MRVLSAIVLFLVSCSACQAADLPRSSPESQGVSSAAITAFVEAADKNLESLNSFMLVRHGHVIAEGWWTPYHPEANHALYSLSKSFTSTAVGLAVAEGKLSVDDLVLKFFPDEAPKEPGDNLKAMRVSDLLRMATGHQTEPQRPRDASWAKAFLAHEVPFKPGTHFAYNTSATYMQSAIVQKVTGMTVLDYLKPRLFEPLGIANPTWELSPQGISTGGYGLSIRTEDIARFGQLYLQKGMWQGKRLVPEAWIEAATARQVSNGSNPASDWDQGYGYQFWRCRNNGYRGDGAFGQYCVVLPEHDVVIAITSGLGNMQQPLDLVWDKLLPAFKSAALPADDAARTKLDQTLKGLTLRPQSGSGSPAKSIARKYVFPPNEHKLEAVTVKTDGSAVNVTMRFDGVETQAAYTPGEWKKGKAGWALLKEQPVATSGAWTEDGTFTGKICFFETPFTVTLNLKFVDGELRYYAKSNVGFALRNDIELIGIAGEHAQPVASTPAGGSDPNLAAATARSVVTAAPAAGHDYAKWEKEIAAYEASDKTNPPPKGGILFVGSSTIRMWKSMADDFPGYKVINRGVGGSEIVDATYYADRIIFPYEPKLIFLRAGGNDIHAGHLPEKVADDFAAFVQKVHARLPNTEIIYMPTSPAPARWSEKDKNKALNEMIRERAVKLTRTGFIDAHNMTLNADGSARSELFIEDKLHFNADGYKLLAEYVRPYLGAAK